jgi:hypothetical protein
METLALEAVTAISNLDITEQNYHRNAVVKNIKTLKQSINTIPKENMWKYMNMNPRAPNLTHSWS